MQDLFTATALVLVIEGMLWSLFPDTMKRAVERTLSMERGILRSGGLAIATLGVVLVWIIRG